MSLAAYHKKRDFKRTAEPKGRGNKEKQYRFVVQRHHASHLHYDFRLELGGVLKSWAVPKGPSMNPSDKRLAMMVEDHPVDYISFKGIIPKGNYGAGKVEIWDHGYFLPVNEKHETVTEKQAVDAIKKGEIKFTLKGKKLQGEFVLIHIKNRNDEKRDNAWLLVKHRDDYAVNAIYNAEDKKISTRHQNTVASIRNNKAKKLDHFIQPMLAGIAKAAFDDIDWLYEIKWDGYRAIAELKKGALQFYSRNGIDFSQRFPFIAKAVEKLKHDVILDGEIVLMNEKNLPDFQKLQHYENHLDYPLIYYVFDLLMLNGKDTKELPLTDRKALLKKLLKDNDVLRYCDDVDKQGIEFFAKAKEQGLEGIIAKRKDSTYTAAVRSKAWLKIKNTQSTEVMIAGYTAPKGGRKYFGSLILASKKGRGWQYRGHVGTGFNAALLKSLKEKMDALKNNASVFKEKVPVNGETTWLKPKLVADIAYTEITNDGIFRHPVFMRLSNEKSINNINDESMTTIEPVAKEREIKVDKDVVVITNAHKIFWPEEGYTKGDVVNYYDSMANYILPYLKNRPLSLKRNPNGIRDAGFFHKDAGENAPQYADVFPVHSDSSNKTIDYIVCNNKATLLYLANLGCIEINPWNSTVQKPDNPTWIVIDIDPSYKNSFTEVTDVALATKEVLESAGIDSVCKTSGASGLHVYAGLKNKYDYNTVRDFAHIVASLVQEKLPRITTLERSLGKRGPKIYIDYLQNRSGQTLASVYSLRPVSGAGASTPLEWKEVNHRLHPSMFTIATLPERLKQKGDLFSSVLSKGNNILKALKLLDK